MIAPAPGSEPMMEAAMTAMRTTPMTRMMISATMVMRVMSRVCPMRGRMRPLVRSQTSPGVAMRPRTERETATMSRPVRMVVASAVSRAPTIWEANEPMNAGRISEGPASEELLRRAPTRERRRSAPK